MRDSKEILHTLRNYLLHNLHKTWPLARPGAQAVPVFPIHFCFVFHFRFVCAVSFSVCVVIFNLHGFCFVCSVSPVDCSIDLPFYEFCLVGAQYYNVDNTLIILLNLLQ